MSTPADPRPVPPSDAVRSGPARAVALVGVWAVAAVATWWAWLGWESGYTTDPATGAVSGPYAVWQVVACGVTLLVLAVVAGWWSAPWFAAPAITLPFTAAWTVHAARVDDTGLFAVGAVLLLVGLGTASALVCTTVWLIRRYALRRPG